MLTVVDSSVAQPALHIQTKIGLPSPTAVLHNLQEHTPHKQIDILIRRSLCLSPMPVQVQVHINTIASAGRPASVSGSYIWGLPLFSCLELDGLTSFSVPS